MNNKNYLELAKFSLPDDLDLEDLISLAPSDLCEANPCEAFKFGLSSSPRINWQAYLHMNPDVKQAGMDAATHFINYGIYEGRKLVTWHPLKQKNVANQPLISVIILNYNNATFLEHCIASITSQSLSNIEILIVDDCSNDGSMSIIEKHARSDQRIKYLRNGSNIGTFMFRKRSVRTASGQYIMFLDSDDFLTSNACEIAYNNISEGYDGVIFNEASIDLTNHDSLSAINHEKYINRANSGVYTRKDILKSAFIDNQLPRQVNKMICLREIMVRAYELLDDGYYIRSEDAIGMISILSLTRTIKKNK